MKLSKSILVFVCLIVAFSVKAAIIIDHEDIDITSLTLAEIQQVKSDLHIVMGGTSHASQVTTGLWALNSFIEGGGYGLSFPAGTFSVSFGDGSGNALDYRNGAINGTAGTYPEFYNETVRYYDHSITEGPRVNVFFWMFCAELSFDYDQQDVIDYYLQPMQQLEAMYPDVTFIYSTGHLDGDVAGSQRQANNDLIRQFCLANDKILFDFADIEKYDPDGTYYGDRHPTDAGGYDYNNNGVTEQDGGDPALPINGDRNWAIDWANAHTEGVEWYDCEAAHTYPVNANMKACAAWNLFVEIAELRASGTTNQPPVLTVPGSQTMNEEQTLSFTVSATDPNIGDILTYSASNLPSNASFNPATREFTFTPNANQSGIYNVTFSVTDGQLTDDEDVIITVLNTSGSNTAPVFTSTGSQTANEGQTLSFTVSATDADGDALLYSVSDNPQNSYFVAATQEFFFTPNYQQSGTYNVIFSVTDGQDTDNDTVQITVNNVNQQPVVSSLSDQVVYVGNELSFNIVVSDQDPVDNIVLNATGLPTGAQLAETSTRIWTFTWTPGSGDVGSYEVIFTASDGSLTDTDTTVIIVDESAPTGNLALGRPTEASASEATCPDTCAVDGDMISRWSSGTNGTHWISVNLEAAYSINLVVIVWEGAYSSQYQVQVSSNGNDWNDVYSTITGDGGTDSITFSSVSAQYVRVYSTMGIDPDWNVSIIELEVYGSMGSSSTIAEGVAEVETSASEILSKELVVSQNYPNPFSGLTRISYQISSESNVRLEILDIQGREIAILLDEIQPSGCHQATFNANSLSGGIYFYKLTAGGFTQIKKMTLTK